MFFVRIAYGFLSFPWLIFLLPPFKYMITKCKKTGYDKFGNTVPLKCN
jgi:hypothetical protein